MRVIEKAILFATEAHMGINRKGKTRPYILHPLEVLTIVASLTEEEDVLAAAVLHDTVEDTETTREDILREFGARIAALVASESEDKREAQPAENTWKIRKSETLRHLMDADRDTKLICLGDKLANLREIGRDYAALGDDLWDRFNQKDKNLHGWYYSSIYKVLIAAFGDVPPIREYKNLLLDVFGWEGD